jgi:RNA polymerase sigma factor (TIGR02999 family)
VELQPTELVAEAWLKLDHADLEPMHRRHFIALSARIMRQVLVDHARRRQADKRGGGWLHVTLSRLEHDPDVGAFDLLALDDAMDRLAERHSRAANVIELHYFGGMTADESAAHLNVTPRTIERDLRFGRAWLKDHLDA